MKSTDDIHNLTDHIYKVNIYVFHHYFFLTCTLDVADRFFGIHGNGIIDCFRKIENN